MQFSDYNWLHRKKFVDMYPNVSAYQMSEQQLSSMMMPIIHQYGEVPYDLFEKQITLGDRVAIPVVQGQSIGMTVGRVTKITKYKVQIETERRSGYWCKDFVGKKITYHDSEKMVIL